MKMTEMTVAAFAELLASNAPAPGGGSAAALIGSVGVALITMVAELTTGKSKYSKYEGLMHEIIDKGTELRADLLDDMERDTQVYNGVTAVFAMPNSTDREKAHRKVAMQQALKKATKVPFEIMERAYEALELAEKAIGCSNTNAISDIGVGVLNLKAAVQGAWLNVLINLGSIDDEAFVEKYKAEGTVIVDKSLTLADNIYEEVLKQIAR